MIKEGVILGGRYEIMERIGMGGMADVYKAADRVLRRYVAVKVLKREFREDENFVNKFRSEAQAAAGLTHPNIVNIYDVAEDRGLYYIVMELVEGITLKDYIQKKGKLTPKEVIGITLQVCSGIDSAHANKIIHRDIKPQNIMISKEGKVKVTDFGIAKATSSNTISTNVMGSVHYTSPEQARGGFSDAKSDIYSLGITMYEMLTGQLPFDGDSTVSIALKHLQEDMVPPSELVLDVPYSLEQIILKCTQKSPDRRYTDVAMLVRDLKRSIQDPEGDFVRISPLTMVGDTILMTEDEMAELQGVSGYDDEYESGYDKKRASNDINADLDPKMTKLMKVLTIVAIVIFAGVLIFGGIWIYNISKNMTNIPSGDEQNLVPNMVGMTLDEAKEACEDVGLELVVIDDTKLHLEYDKDYIYKQSTSPNVSRPAGTKIEVHVSAGLQPIEMPDVSGKTEEEALTELKRLGFQDKLIEIEKEEHTSVKAGDVIRTNPKAGTEDCNSKTKIILYVSKGVGETIVPDLGKASLLEAQAEKLLKDAGLVGEPTYVPSFDVAEGIVLEQEEKDYKIGATVPKGTVIKYTVSKGDTVEIPTDLVGKDYKEVEQILLDLDLEVKLIEDTDTEVEKAGMVTEVEGEGKKVEFGWEVKVYYSNKVSGAEQTPDGGTGNDGESQTPTGQ